MLFRSRKCGWLGLKEGPKAFLRCCESNLKSVGEEKNGAFGERGKGQWFHAIIKCGLEQWCGMRMVMTYCKHTGYGAVFGVLSRVERCKI